MFNIVEHASEKVAFAGWGRILEEIQFDRLIQPELIMEQVLKIRFVEYDLHRANGRYRLRAGGQVV